jgi:hypothetical protein
MVAAAAQRFDAVNFLPIRLNAPLGSRCPGSDDPLAQALLIIKIQRNSATIRIQCTPAQPDDDTQCYRLYSVSVRPMARLRCNRGRTTRTEQCSQQILHF